MRQPYFDIFRGPVDNPVWVENVMGLVKACEHMQRHATEKPDCYFVYDRKADVLMAEIDSRASLTA
jgi:phosphoglycolate phosphatase-like HAD superfamily hydrolase